MIPVVPIPRHLEERDGSCRLADAVVRSDGVAADVVDRARRLLRGSEPGDAATFSGGTAAVVSLHQEEDVGEAYVLTVDREGARLQGGRRGLHQALATLHQLILLYDYVVPCLRIEDEPRFPWRGVHLDVCRHMFSTPFVCKLLDMMAVYHLNTFHWHLTEDQGWRIEVEGYPELTRTGAWRTDQGGGRYGGYYTAEDVIRVVKHAAGLGIEVVPEVEMPGHAQALIASYPHLGCTGRSVAVRTEWGISREVLCAGNEEVYGALEGILERVLEMFPSRYVHVGGDECPKDRWRQCGRCQERMRREGLANEEELQSYFIRRIGSFLKSRGRRLVGWDEILEGGLAPGAVVMSWRGMQGGVAAARQGHEVVMTPSNPCYLNMRQAAYQAEPGVLRSGAPVVDLETVYRWDPVSAELDEDAASHVIGGQACMWTERVSQEAVVEYLFQPRLAALAEVLWSPLEHRSWDGFSDRMRAHGAVLTGVGWGYRRSPELDWSERAPT